MLCTRRNCQGGHCTSGRGVDKLPFCGCSLMYLVSISSTVLLFAEQHCVLYQEPDSAVDGKLAETTLLITGNFILLCYAVSEVHVCMHVCVCVCVWWGCVCISIFWMGRECGCAIK